MRRTLLAIMMIALAAGGMSLAHHGGHSKGGDYVKVLSQRDIIEKLDGKKAKATMVEVTLAPGEVEAAHRHPGKKNKARFIAVVLHPEDAKELVIPEKEKK